MIEGKEGDGGSLDGGVAGQSGLVGWGGGVAGQMECGGRV